MEVMAGEEGGGGGSSQQLTDRSAPPSSEETHSIYWQIPSSASHYVIHLHGENRDPNEKIMMIRGFSLKHGRTFLNNFC